MDETKAGSNRPIAAGRLWAGGAATAVVAALVAILGILVARGLFSVSILAPTGDGVWGDVHTTTYALLAAAAALVATAMLNLVLGLVITNLLVSVAHSARVPRHGYTVARPRA